jgi:hypothetical protein
MMILIMKINADVNLYRYLSPNVTFLIRFYDRSGSIKNMKYYW